MGERTTSTTSTTTTTKSPTRKKPTKKSGGIRVPEQKSPKVKREIHALERRVKRETRDKRFAVIPVIIYYAGITGLKVGATIGLGIALEKVANEVIEKIEKSLE